MTADPNVERAAELFEQFANSTEVGLFLREGEEPLYMSPKFLRMVGFDPDQRYPTLLELRSMIHPDDRAIAASSIAAADRGETPLPTEIRVPNVDGTTRWLRASNRPIVRPDGSFRVASLFIDITDLKEAELAAHDALLEAERANAAKTEFLSRMSHELRTPLNAILGFGQLLEMRELDSDDGDSVRHIVQAGKHLLGLIDEVLDISRMEQGALRLSLEPVSVTEVVDEVVKMIRPLAEDKAVEIVDDSVGRDVYVRADRQRLKQVIVNLLMNAVKYNRDGGQVRIDHGSSERGRFRLTITDTGIGIAEEHLHRLFQPFDRLSAEGSQIEGTGLGLALTRRLMTAMEGRIGVTSSLGEGSSFWIELPLTAAPEIIPGTDPIDVLSGVAPPADHRATVLYVEDNLSNVRLVEQILALRKGVTLKVAMEGQNVIQMAEAHAPDLILLDLNLPDISGAEVLRRLKLNERTAAIPVVVVSADATADQPKRLIALGATDYVTKPFDIPRLLAVIDGLGGPENEKASQSAIPPSATLVEPSEVEPTVESELGGAGMSKVVHDLNNSLGVIKLSQSLLTMHVTDPIQASRLTMIGDAADRAIALTSELSTFGESGSDE